MSALNRLREESLPKRTRFRPPTSSPFTPPADSTVTSTLPFLTTLNSIPGTHHIAGFLRTAFAEYLRLRHDITISCNVNDSDRLRLLELKDMIALAKMILGISGHDCTQFHVVDKVLDRDCVRGYWWIEVPIYRLSKEDVGQRPTLYLGMIKLLKPGTRKQIGFASDALPTEEYEWMLHILISKIIRILGSDCVPVVMNPILTERFSRYVEPLTRVGRRDSIEFPAIEGETRPRFRLLGLPNEEAERRGWVRTGKFGWANVQEERE